MKKAFIRSLKIAVLTFLAAILTIAYITLFPQQIFANNVSYKEFSVYSNNKIDDHIKIILDSAINLVQKSELYDSKYN